MYKARFNESTKRKFCPICKDWGKSEKIYTSHFVRASYDKNSPITCPTILGNVCLHCKKEGHFENFCPIKTRKVIYKT